MVQDLVCEFKLGFDNPRRAPVLTSMYRGFKFALLEISKCTKVVSVDFSCSWMFRTEVVLAVLLSTYKFETTSERPITWKSASAVLYPTTGEESTRPEMFLKLSKIALASR